MKSIYISYSSINSDWARSLCGMLEEHGGSCFLAERDLDRTRPDWAKQLMEALVNSSKVILLLSRASNSSQEVLNEIANASARGIEIIPILRENLPISDVLMYFIRKYEWIQLFDYSEADGTAIICKRILGLEKEAVPMRPEPVAVNELTQYEDECFADIQTGGYGAGYDKCLIQNGVKGWSPSDIVLEEVSDDAFTFSDIGRPELDEEYRAYCGTPEIRKMQMRGNDRKRWMLDGYYQNSRIFLTVRSTTYSMASFWWNRVRNHPDVRKSMAESVFAQDDTFYPNSLCLHLILETLDGQLICTRISNNKKNDYVRSIAVTLGEQLSEIDFGENRSYNNSFVEQWIKRALIEEFGFHNAEYEKYVDTSSYRVFALSYESDIYNFALPVYVRLRMDYQGLLTYVNSMRVSIDEFTEIIPKTAAEALEITRSWSREAEREKYHPSSFLRALLYAMYKGADRVTSEES